MYLRCFLKEYQRGERIALVDPGDNNDLQIYREYLNYTHQTPASSYQFVTTEI